MIENCKKYLVKGLKIHSKTINLFTVESNISKQLNLIQKKFGIQAANNIQEMSKITLKRKIFNNETNK